MSSRQSNGHGLAYICEHYGVPAEIGGMVAFEGRPGVILGTTAHYLRIKLFDEPAPGTFHATWHIEYLPCPGCGAPAGYPPAGPCERHGQASAKADA